MELNNFFKNDLFLLDEKIKTKEELIKEMAKILVAKRYATNCDEVFDLAIKRENETSTGIGENIAIPHIRSNVMNESVIFFAKVNNIEWKSIDNKPVDYVFFIALNEKNNSSHVEILAKLMNLFINDSFKQNLKEINDFKSLNDLINKFLTNEEQVKNINNDDDKSYDVVAVTSCPTGIAHTFMARDSLIKAANELNVKIKVETQGADGAKNVLTNNEIANAKGVIIACDRTIDLSKFKNNSNIIEIGTKDVIKNAKNEIEKILNNKGKPLKIDSKKSEEEDNSSMSFAGFGKRAYKSLMTGVSYMLPFVVFGGILIALAFLFDINNAGNSNFGSGNNVARWTKGLGDLAFGLLVPILAAYICNSIIGRQGILPGFIVGLIANGKFFFTINVENGQVDWFGVGGPNSGVFGAIGGAFLAAAIFILMSKLFSIEINTKNGKKTWFPTSLNGIKNILIFPLFGTFFVALTFWILNIPLIYLNWGFSKFLNLFEGKAYLAWLLGLIIGAMMAVDLGGPINKAAYIFAITSLTNAGGNGTVAMAASMAGGMVPPIGIALSCTFFKKLWSKEDRQSGYLNYIMGLTFISEGAIPLTLKNPKVMIPANIIGSSVTGLLIGALGVTIAAPHGGILTVALAKSNLFDNNSLSIGLGIVFFIVALIIGSVTEMFVIFLLYKIQNKKMKNKKNENINDNKINKEIKSVKMIKIKNNKIYHNYLKLNKVNILKIKSSNKYDIYNNFFTFNRLCYKFK